MSADTCDRCGKHESEVPLSEVGDVCVRCEQALLEQQDARRPLDDHYEEEAWLA